MRNHKQIRTLGAPHSKAHLRYWRKLKDFKYSLWSETYGTNNTMFFSWFLDQIVLEPESKASRCWSRSQKI